MQVIEDKVGYKAATSIDKLKTIPHLYVAGESGNIFGWKRTHNTLAHYITAAIIAGQNCAKRVSRRQVGPTPRESPATSSGRRRALQSRNHGAVIALAVMDFAPRMESSHEPKQTRTLRGRASSPPCAVRRAGGERLRAHGRHGHLQRLSHRRRPAIRPPSHSSAMSAGTATYSVHQTQAAWAAFDGSTYITGGTASDATFSGPSGHPFNVFAVTGLPGPIGITRLNQAVTTYTITPSAGANGSISPATAQTVAAGEATPPSPSRPNAGYQVDALTVDGARAWPRPRATPSRTSRPTTPSP